MSTNRDLGAVRTHFRTVAGLRKLPWLIQYGPAGTGYAASGRTTKRESTAAMRPMCLLGIYTSSFQDTKKSVASIGSDSVFEAAHTFAKA